MEAIEAEKRLAILASGQWGLVTTPQAVAEGVSHSQLSRLAERDVIARLSHGVYVLRSAPVDRHVDLRAAWLALNPKRTAGQRLQDPSIDAVVSHASAAAFRGWGDLTAYDSEFTFDGRKQSRRTDVRLHQGSTSATDVEIIDGLPVTTAERLIVDLLSTDYDFDHIGAVLAGAIRSRAIDLGSLALRVAPYASGRGFGPRRGADVTDALVEAGDARLEAAADQLVGFARADPAAMSAGLREVLAKFQPPPLDPAAMEGLRQVLAKFQPPPMDPAVLARQNPTIRGDVSETS